jgi:acyl dehydratase
MAPLTIDGLDALTERIGQELGVSDWHEVTQADIDAFAEVTGDHQWIHVDPERARSTPFGGTIAHGYYSVSLIPRFSYELLEMTGVAFGLNYGANRVRFPAPLPVGSKVRMRMTLQAVEEIAGGAQVTMLCTLEREGGDKPVCVAETLSRFYSG